MIQHYRARIEVREDDSGRFAYVDLRLNGNKASALKVDIPLGLREDGAVKFDIENSRYHVGGDSFEYSFKRGLVGVLDTMSKVAQDKLVPAFKRHSEFSKTVVFNADDGRTCGAERSNGLKKLKSNHARSHAPRKILD